MATKLTALELQDQISERIGKARGICALASLVPGQWDQIADDALPNAMSAVRELLCEVEELAARFAKKEARHD